MNMHIRRSEDYTLASKEAIWFRRKQRAQFLDGNIKPNITLIIPAKNEAKNLPWVMERIPKTVTEVILVDGNSTDETIEVFKELRPDGIVLQQYANGKGSALATGLTAATGDIIVMIDADGSMDPIEIHGLVGALLSGADVVKSSRYVAGGGSDDISHLRNFGNQGLRIVSKVLFGHDWSELAYGYAAFWKDIIPLLHLEPIFEKGNPQSKKEYGRGFEIEALLFTRSQRLGLKVAEVFSFEYPRIHGESNLSTFKDGWRVLMALFRERFTPIPKNPEQGIEPVMIVGSGSKFLSGISHYTAHLANGLANIEPTTVILMRNLIPKFFYPGRQRVGDESLSSIRYHDNVAVYDGVDWQGGKSLRKAKKFIQTTHPRVVVFQWWTAAVSFNYLSLMKAAVKNNAKIIIEFHEIQDVGEARLPLASRVGKWAMHKMLKNADGIIVHSSHDLEAVHKAYPLSKELSYKIITHGPYDALIDFEVLQEKRKPKKESDTLKLMFFGVIRPYKGLPLLIEAFQGLLKQKENVELTIVGEPWGNDAKALLDEAKKQLGGKVNIIPRYVEDAEIPYLLEDVDVLVLPYLRSSASGPIALAMAAGMPVVTTDIPTLIEATEGYTGAIHVPVNDVSALVKGIKSSRKLVGKKHDNPLSWDKIANMYHDMFDELGK